MNFQDLPIAALIQGYHPVGGQLQCNYCTARFSEPEAVITHLNATHGGALDALLTADTKYNTLTETQIRLLQAFSLKQKNQAIADQLGVSASTIRHQKFTFREKAKQARLYLAQYQAVFGDEPTKDYLPIPPMATDNDDRFRITETEYADTTQKYFTFTDAGIVLTRLPKGQKKIITLLYRIADEFSFNTKYPQHEVDTKLKAIYFDYGIIKRYLIDYGFLARTTDNRTYWRIF
ncbi:hypothetical protein AYR62_15185 [Secundilactobacillus paracollinoides]|uniref:C2H2-type domain-containing protein n=1 Tax=Secundilactobacillus paracollinoides TaxID=240427 RepID=A0A1B2IW31_9LACO|nr:DUF2087 domain-containing protein [Secundilactobacillus paracollinoides]ANZ60427.1 hypothetical protein AYR61_03085 [Secundilactobacillus paracollinoides]ANZ65289.1 hypothetical protein AYR62_15185 [Secundilactobacillus paracollinoides]ANZ66255.1 hypothetical protein AYR63_03290 [Secundilactobacillus paracollinoides]KRL76683.1 hypothetical protein FC17_GL001748 [Secundilactobacillus paracollinoides DSM 15502 = JCM 11969]